MAQHWKCSTPRHRVLGGLFTYQKNIRKLKDVFFGAKPYGEQRLPKAFCPLWEGLTNLFEKKPFRLLNNVLEGKQLEKSLLKKKVGKNMI